MKFFTLLKQKRQLRFTLMLILSICYLRVSSQTQAYQSDQAANLPGINTHFNYRTSLYNTSYDQCRDLLIDLGIRHIRDANNWGAKDRFNELAGNGIKVTLICDILRHGNPSTWEDEKNITKAIMNMPNSPVEYIEGPNEFDLSGEVNWIVGIQQRTKDLYNTYKGDTETSWIPILGPSFGNTKSSPQQVGDLSNYLQYGNLHCYPGGTHVEGTQGGGWEIPLDQAISNYVVISGSKPRVSTETGYQMAKVGHGNLQVTERAAAIYTPRLFLTYLKKGFEHAYHYQLVNDNSENFGVVNTDFTKRKQYYSIKNFIALFNDKGSNFAPQSLNYSLSGDLTDIQSMLFQKRDGTFLLAIWQAVKSCNQTKDGNPTDIVNSGRNITVNFGATAVNGETYLPSFFSEAQSTFNNVNSLRISVPDHIIVLKFVII